MKRLIKVLPPMYLGFALSKFANVYWDQWEFYAVLVPFWFLVKLTDFNK
jgi:hypothetical protein